MKPVGAPRPRLLAAALVIGAAGSAGMLAPARAVAGPPPSEEDGPAPTGAIYGFDSDEEIETVPARARATESSGELVATHTVRKGDTLWDISRTYFRDPWRWPKVWALNPEIANPHWIFPGQLVRLRDPAGSPGAAVVSEPSSEPAATPAPSITSGALPAPPAEAQPDTHDLRQIGFVDEGGLKAAGVINGSLEEKILLASGDHAYVEFPANRPPKGGAKYMVYQVDTDHPIREPGSKNVLGYLVHVFGEVLIDSFTDRPIANARLVDLVAPVERGYRVGPSIQQLKSVTPKKNQADMTARVVASLEPNLLIGNQMFVVLNRGRRHGIEVGNRFLVLRQGDGIKRIMEDWDATDHRFPPHAVAEIFAVSVQDETTIGWVSRGTRELHTGDLADLRRGY